MKTLLTALTILISTATFAQTTAYWIGGTPGQETNWNVAQNWSNNRVPDGSTNVIIKKDNSGHYSQPVIKHQVEVLSIKIYNHCTLNVAENGFIFIDGDSFYTEGIEVIGGKLINQGSIVMNNVDGDYSDQLASEGDNKPMILRKEFVINGSRIPAK